jgi:hypothetical protein
VTDGKPDNEFAALIARFEARGRAASAVRKATPPEELEIVYLPMWPEGFRGIPNGILRSALFGVVRKGRRTFENDVQKASLKGTTIRFTGQQLDQSDLDVWEYCLHLCRERGLGVKIEFSNYHCLKTIKRSQGGKNVEWLKSVLHRLMIAVVTIHEERLDYSGALIYHYSYNAVDCKNTIVLNQRLINLFKSGWTRIEWEERNCLRGKPLAQWLHGFYHTHAEPHPLKVATLQRLSGSTATTRHFKNDLKEVLKLLSEVTGWVCGIDEKGLVHVERTKKA